MLERSKRGLIREVVTVTGYELECAEKGCPHVARFGSDYSRPSVELSLGQLGWSVDKKGARWRCGACEKRLAQVELPLAEPESREEVG